MKSFTRFALIALTAISVWGCTSTSAPLDTAAVAQQFPRVDELSRLLSKAENDQVQILAPDGFEQAKAFYEEAFSRAKRQRTDANDSATAGLRVLRQAIEDADTSRNLMREVLATRDKAIAAGARETHPDRFSDLESDLREATRAVETGEITEAKELRAALIREYSSLELVALKKLTGEEARAALEAAREADADTYAPETFSLAQEQLALALDILDAGRTQTSKARRHAAQSVYYSNQSIHITDLISDFERRNFDDEDKVLWYQQQLEIVNQPFDKSLPLDRPNQDVVDELQSRVSRLQQRQRSAQSSLEGARLQIAALQAEIEGLEQQLQGEAVSMQAQLEQIRQANREAQARYDRIQAMFSDDEAYVFRQANNVLLETHAFNFKVGGSEIDSENYPLLEKIMEAIEVFDDPRVLITGHTDSTGSTALNLDLSRKRARTVASFLQRIGKIPPERISTQGYGESRPVASNETIAGRARNRRIEVLIIN